MRAYLQWGVLGLFLGVLGLTMMQTPDVHGQSDCDSPRIPYLDFWDGTDFCNTTVDINEIRPGGPPPDGIPPIDNPKFESIKDARVWLNDQSPVISLEVNGEARAYPLAILTRHEIANDVIADVPVAVTYCPLCNASIVFDRRVDGEVYRFGVSGLLRNSDMVMWDDVTKSWWQQFTGSGIVGVHAGTELTVLPSIVVGFKAFVEQYPDGQVLTRESSGYSANMYGGNPYGQFKYDTNDEPFLYDGEIDSRLRATERVLGGIIDTIAVAYPFETLAVEQVVNDTIGERDIVVFWQPGKASAMDGNIIDESRDVGMAGLYRRELDDNVLTFSLTDDGVIVDDRTGSVWNVFGTAVSGELEGAQLRQEIAAPHFWFAWAAFVPETIVYGIDD